LLIRMRAEVQVLPGPPSALSPVGMPINALGLGCTASQHDVGRPAALVSGMASLTSGFACSSASFGCVSSVAQRS
jgi:hypothetical protein